MTVVVLPDVPGLGGVYARGAASSVRPRRQTDLPDVEYVVRSVRADAAHLTEYQHLLGESASDRLPAGFVHVLAFPVATALMARNDFPLRLAGLVHLSNHVTQHRPLTLADSFDVRATRDQPAGAPDGNAGRPGDHGLASTTTSRGAGCRPTWRRASSCGVRAPTSASPSSRPCRPASGCSPRTPVAGTRRCPATATRSTCRRSTAKAFGFPRAIAHGMYTASLALASVGAARGDAFEWSVDFFKPVLLPSTVSVRVAAGADGFDLAAWSSVPHLTGTVTPLA